MRVIVNILKFFVFMLICLVLGLGIYSFSLISEINRSGSFSLDKDFFSEKSSSSIFLDQDSYISKDDFKFLFNFMNQTDSFDEWWENQFYFNNFEKISGNTFKVLNSQTLELDKGNTCGLINCYQKRVHFSDIPSVLWRGLIGIEDFRFLDHKGIDPLAILRAIIADIKAGKFVQGGSTLTQQLVKNLYFSNSKSLIRKLKEAILSIYIESRYEKEEILQAYFNEVEWGVFAGLRVKGIHAASKIYFNKNPRDLNNYEAIILSSMLKGPNLYHPLKNQLKLRGRADHIYKRLKEKELISKYDDSQWNDLKWESLKKDLAISNTDTRYKSFSYAIKEDDFMKHFIIHDETSLFLKKYDKDIAVKFYSNSFECDQRYCDFNYYSKLERDSIENLEYKIQVGSLLKPLIYQSIISESGGAYEEISTEPIELSLLSGVWIPRDRPFTSNYITLDQALKESRNIPLIRKSRDFGFLKLENELLKYNLNLKTPLSEYPSQLLGSIEMNFFDLFKSYKVFKNSECDTGRRIYFLLNDPNENTLKNVVNEELSYKEFFGKTGTTNKGLDSWFLTLDDDKFHAIWVGLEGDRKGKELPFSGSRIAFKLFQSYLMRSGQNIRPLNCLSSGQKEQILDIN